MASLEVDNDGQVDPLLRSKVISTSTMNPVEFINAAALTPNRTKKTAHKDNRRKRAHEDSDDPQNERSKRQREDRSVEHAASSSALLPNNSIPASPTADSQSNGQLRRPTTRSKAVARTRKPLGNREEDIFEFPRKLSDQELEKSAETADTTKSQASKGARPRGRPKKDTQSKTKPTSTTARKIEAKAQVQEVQESEDQGRQSKRRGSKAPEPNNVQDVEYVDDSESDEDEALQVRNSPSPEAAPMSEEDRFWADIVEEANKNCTEEDFSELEKTSEKDLKSSEVRELCMNVWQGIECCSILQDHESTQEHRLNAERKITRAIDRLETFVKGPNSVGRALNETEKVSKSVKRLTKGLYQLAVPGLVFLLVSFIIFPLEMCKARGTSDAFDILRAKFDDLDMI